MKSEKIGDTTFEEWTAEELAEAFARNQVAIIDVRTPAEYSFEHIDGALLAPMHNFKPENLPYPDTGKPMVFHCGSGKRSRTVAEACAKAGFKKVIHLEGGFGAWKAARLPYMTVNPATGGVQRVEQK